MEDKTDNTNDKPDVSASDPDTELAQMTDKWKRALADSENARKRADMAQLDGR